MKEIKAIMVGMGTMALNGWIPTVKLFKNIHLAACVDSDGNAIKRAVDLGAIPAQKCHNSLEEAYNSNHSDLAIIVTPPEHHKESCCQALKMGMHVLCEKPIANNINSALKIVSSAEKYKKIVMIAQNRRHTTPIHTLRELVQTEKYGPAEQVYINFHQIFSRDSYRDTMEQPLILDMAIHHFDAMIFILGKLPTGVAAIGWNPKGSRFRGIASANVLFDFETTMRVVYNGSWHTANGSMTSNGCDWRIECEKGVLLCKGDIVYEAPNGDYLSGTLGGELKPSSPVYLNYRETAYLLNEMVECIQGNKVPGTVGKESINTLSVVLSTIHSIDNRGKWTPIPHYFQKEALKMAPS